MERTQSEIKRDMNLEEQPGGGRPRGMDSKDDGSGGFTCEVCGSRKRSEEELQDHYRVEHSSTARGG